MSETDAAARAEHQAAAAARRGSDCQTSWHDDGLGHVCRIWRGHPLPHRCTVSSCSSVFPPAFAHYADEAGPEG